MVQNDFIPASPPVLFLYYIEEKSKDKFLSDHTLAYACAQEETSQAGTDMLE